MTGRTDRSRVRWVPAVVLLVLLVAFAVASVLLFVLPASDDVPTITDGGPVDAVVVLGGSPGLRYEAAVRTTARMPEPPPLLALSVQYDEPVITCGREPRLPRVTLRCFSPAPPTTAGEAAWIAEEAAAEGWRRVVVTTSDYHVTRTRVLVEHCVAALSPDTEVLYRSVDTDALSVRGVWAVATEWPSLLGTAWDHRSTCDG